MKRKAYKTEYKQDDVVKDIYKVEGIEKSKYMRTYANDGVTIQNKILTDMRGTKSPYISITLFPNIIFTAKALLSFPRNNIDIKVNGIKKNIELEVDENKWFLLFIEMRDKDLYVNDILLKEDCANESLHIGKDCDMVIYNPLTYELYDKFNEYKDIIIRKSKFFFNSVIRRNVDDNFNDVSLGSKETPIDSDEVLTGSYNHIELTQRNIDFASINAFNEVIANGSLIEPKLRSKPFNWAHAYIAANTYNNIFVKKNNKNIMLIANNNNVVDTNGCYEYCIFNNNNSIKDVNLDIKNEIILMTDRPKLSVKTEIKDYGSNYIVVADTSYILLNHYVMFTTRTKAFEKKKVTKVVDNKVYFENNIESTPIIGGFLYSNPPKEYNEYVTYISKDVPKYRRRIFVDKVDENANLYMRDVIIGGVVKSIVNYADTISNVVIINDVTDIVLNKGQLLRCPEYKFIKEREFIIGNDLPNVYIGEKVMIEGNTYSVSGFDKTTNSITFSETDEDFSGKKAIKQEVPKEYYAEKTDSIKFIPQSGTKKYSKWIKFPNDIVDNVSTANYKYAMIDGVIADIEAIYSNYIELDIPNTPLLIDNAVIYKNSILYKDSSIEEINELASEFEEIIKNKDL